MTENRQNQRNRQNFTNSLVKNFADKNTPILRAYYFLRDEPQVRQNKSVVPEIFVPQLGHLLGAINDANNVIKTIIDPVNPIVPPIIPSNPHCITTDGLSWVLNESGVAKPIIKPIIIIEPPIINGTFFIWGFLFISIYLILHGVAQRFALVAVGRA